MPPPLPRVWRRSVTWVVRVAQRLAGSSEPPADDADTRGTLTHPDTLRSMTELATTLRAAGNLAEAEALEEQVQALQEERVRRLNARLQRRH